MPHWCCMSGRIPTIDVLFPMIDNLCFTDVECLVRLRLFLYCSLWLIIYVSLELYVWSDCDYFFTVSYMTDNVCFTGVVCLLGLRICLFSYPWLIIYVSLMLYIWSDCDNFALFPMIDYLCFTGVVCLVGLRLFCTVPYNW